MGRNTFAFSNVVTVEEVDDFFKKFEERIHPFDDVQYWACYVERRDAYVVDRESYDPDYLKLRNVKGMVQFGLKQELSDVKRWFLSVFGKMLCMHLFVLPVLDVVKHYNFVKETEGLGPTRICRCGKFKEYNEEEEENTLFTAVFHYFVNGGKRGALTDHFPLTKILHMPITKIREQAQYRKKWLNELKASEKEEEEPQPSPKRVCTVETSPKRVCTVETSPKRVCTVETHTESIVTEQEAPLHPPMPHINYFVGRMPTIPEKTSTIPTDGLLGLQ